MRREQQKEERNNRVIKEKCLTDGLQPAPDPLLVSCFAPTAKAERLCDGVKREVRGAVDGKEEPGNE